jgi:hypothetical protein
MRELYGQPKFPWFNLVLVLLLLGSAYGFWIYPRQFPPKAMQVEFDRDAKR